MNGSVVKVNRIMISAVKSGSGKTMFTCALIKALKKRGLKVGARKCGPDYIDPMFHRSVLKVETGNLDPYFTDEDVLRYLLASGCHDNDITVIEGVMGYYDGLGGVSSTASTYDVAVKTDSPVILVVDEKGASVTLAALIKGVLEYRKDNRIRGIILNRISSSFYERIAPVIENECGVKVLGFMPELKDAEIGSRHLGLMQPDEIDGIDERIDRIAEQLNESVDLDGMIEISSGAPDMDDKMPKTVDAVINDDKASMVRRTKPVIAVARDEAFGFWYDDNIRLLKELGAQIEFFSPLHDKGMPGTADGLILYGGYPENHAPELSANTSMRDCIRGAYDNGIPIIAECGGFMYLQDELEDMNGSIHKMCGVLPGKAFYANRLVRFGYMEAEALEGGLYGDKGHKFRGHEFHHWDCSLNGDDFAAVKPMSDKRYRCMVHKDTLAAGFPHIYAYNNPQMYLEFLYGCCMYREKHP